MLNATPVQATLANIIMSQPKPLGRDGSSPSDDAPLLISRIISSIIGYQYTLFRDGTVILSTARTPLAVAHTSPQGNIRIGRQRRSAPPTRACAFSALVKGGRSADASISASVVPARSPRAPARRIRAGPQCLTIFPFDDIFTISGRKASRRFL